MRQRVFLDSRQKQQLGDRKFCIGVYLWCLAMQNARKLRHSSGCGGRICPDAIQHVLALLKRVARAASVLAQAGDSRGKHLPAEACFDFFFF